MAFYQDMQDMARDLLAPDTEGGLGQTTAVLIRTTPGLVDPERPWEVAPPVVQREVLRAAVSGAEKYADGTTILATDRLVVAAVPTMNWKPPVAPDRAVLSLELDGQHVTIVSIKGLPAIGTPAAVQFIARG